MKIIMNSFFHYIYMISQPLVAHIWLSSPCLIYRSLIDDIPRIKLLFTSRAQTAACAALRHVRVNNAFYFISAWFTCTFVPGSPRTALWSERKESCTSPFVNFDCKKHCHHPRKHKAFMQRLYNVGPTSSTLVQHCTNVIQSVYCDYMTASL